MGRNTATRARTITSASIKNEWCITSSNARKPWALNWCRRPWNRQLLRSVRALALDEIYANNRRGAYLNVVDVHSGAVWASEGPLAVDTESWTLVLWELQARSLQWERVVLDGGSAMLAACRCVTPTVQLQ